MKKSMFILAALLIGAATFAQNNLEIIEKDGKPYLRQTVTKPVTASEQDTVVVGSQMVVTETLISSLHVNKQIEEQRKAFQENQNLLLELYRQCMEIEKKTPPPPQPSLAKKEGQ